MALIRLYIYIIEKMEVSDLKWLRIQSPKKNAYENLTAIHKIFKFF